MELVCSGNTREVLDSADDGTRYVHDAWNRLVGVRAVDGGSTFGLVADYRYNGLHWRTQRSNGVDELDLFYYSSDWQLIEERRIAHEGIPAEGNLARVAQQFWGLRYIDDAIARRIDGDADGDYHTPPATETEQSVDGTWFYLTDVQFSVAALVDEIGVLAERVKYDAYGRARHRWPSDLDGDGDSDVDDYNAQVAAASSSIHADPEYRPDADHDRDGDVDSEDFFSFLGGAGQSALPYGLISDPLGPDNPVGYDGYLFAPEAGLNVASGSPQPQALGAYCVRFRWYLPETGRWLERDPAGYVDGMNRFESLGSTPATAQDALGLFCNPPRNGRPYQDFDDLDAMLEFRGDTSRFRYYDSLSASEQRLLQSFVDAFEYAECVFKCVADNPEILAEALAKAGFNYTMDSLKDALFLPGELMRAFMPSFDENGDWSKFDWYDFTDASTHEGARVCHRLARQELDRLNDMLKQHFIRIEDLIRMNADPRIVNQMLMESGALRDQLAAGNMSGFLRRRASDLDSMSRIARGLGKVNGVATIAQILGGAIAELAAKCEDACGVAPGCEATSPN